MEAPRRHWRELCARGLASIEHCHYCRRAVSVDVPMSHDQHLEYDHAIPLARGGAETLANARVACRRWNRAKRDRTVLEWLGTRPAPPWAVDSWDVHPAPVKSRKW